jgi:ankyrin repeat protein
VRVLLEVHADVNQRNDEGITPLMAASSLQNLAVVRWLVKAGADTQIHWYNNPSNVNTTAFLSRAAGTSTERTAYLEAKIDARLESRGPAASVLARRSARGVSRRGTVV